MTPYAALRDRTRRDPASPLLTYRDLATGERMELSAASLGNAVAKTAGLLRDDLDVEPGDVIGVHVPLHWQRMVWLGACASTGAIFAPDADPEECAVVVMDRAHLGLAGTAREDVLVSLAPFGLPEGGPLPAGVTDAAVAMRAHPDVFAPWAEPAADDPLLAGGGVLTQGEVLTQGDVMAAAAEELTRRGVASGGRFALLEQDPLADILGLAGPLACAGAVVIVAHPDAGDLAETLREEGVSAGAG